MSKNASYNTKQQHRSKWAHVLCACLFLYFALAAPAQNLVPNGSFEDTLCCPDDHIGTQLECTGVWFNANSGSADYYHSCSFSTLQIPQFFGENIWDDKSGNGMGGIFNFANGVDFSEYLEVKLIDSLRKGKPYVFSVDLKATYPYLASDAFDVVFTKDTLKTDDWFFHGRTPYVSNPSGHIIADSVNWYTLTAIFAARGGEQFMTMGSFRLSSETQWSDGGVRGGLQSYIMIDNVKLIPFPESEISAPEMPFAIYPNPGNGEFTLTYTFDSSQTHTIYFYNAIGQIVFSQTLNPDLNTEKINLSGLAAGVYPYRVMSGSTKAKWGKLVITN